MKKRCWSAALGTALLTAGAAVAAEITDHGIAAPVSNLCGVVATADRAGHDLAVALLADASGGSGALIVDIAARKSCFVPFPDHTWNIDNRSFTSLLSTKNRYYTAFGKRFFELDLDKRAFTFSGKIEGSLGMGMCEDAQGVIYVHSYPAGNITAFDPATRELREYGCPKKVDYGVYCRYMACDNYGWIYCGTGNTEAEIHAFHPATGTFRQLFPVEGDPVITAASCEVRRGPDGRVFGRTRGARGGYYRALSNGTVAPAESKDWPETETPFPQAAITGAQTLVYRDFPSGRKLEGFDLLERRISVKEPDGSLTEFAFDYPSAGAYLASIEAMPDGTIRGGSFHPMRYFVFDPARNEFSARGNAGCQWNALLADGSHLWVGGYGHGLLVDWDTAKPFEKVSFTPQDTGTPRTCGRGEDDLHRPAGLAMMPGGAQIVMTGSPGYGRTGGGLALYDVRARKFEIIPKETVLGDFSSAGVAPISDHEVLIGTSRMGGTGGRSASGNAELVLYDTVARKVVWRGAPLPDVHTYYQLLRLPDGRVMGLADTQTLFLWDPATREVSVLPGDKTVATQQATRALLCDGKRVIVLFRKSIAEFRPKNNTWRKIADVPQGITVGGALGSGRVWFASKAHLLSVPY